MKHQRIQNLIVISLFAAITAICSWLSIPYTVPFTLQTFAVFFTLLMLGGKNGLISISVYVLLGAVGVPVFAGFKGGLAALTGSTGGYITGFIAGAAVYWLITAFAENKNKLNFIVQAVGLMCLLLTCYLFGTVWFAFIYSGNTGIAGFLSALSVCVIPYIIPDVIKMVLAILLAKKLRPIIGKSIKL